MALPGQTESLILWVATAAMALGTVAFIGMGWGERNEKKQEFYIITVFITAIAFTSYFSMATGFGIVNVSVGGEELPIYWARYADWLFTTPLLLLDLALLAGANRQTIATLIGLDAAMIITGLVGAIATEGAAVRIAWWGISSGFFLVLLFFLVKTLSQQAARRSGDVAATFSTLRNLVVVLWTAYPIVWVLGTESTLAIIPLTVETAAYAVLDVAAKVGFGFILLRSRNVLDQAASANESAMAD